MSLYADLATLRHNTPLNYLVTQFQVIWVYLRLLLLPYGQALEHNYPVTGDLLNLKSALGLAGLLALGWGAWRLRRRRPLVALGVAWFFLTLTVESSVIPLDPLVEHRLYLPLFGLLMAVLAGLPTLGEEKLTLIAVSAAVLICAPLTWQRNALWNDPVAFHKDNLRRAPGSERVRANLADVHLARNEASEAERQLQEALRINPGYVAANQNLSVLYLNQGRAKEAFSLLEEALPYNSQEFCNGMGYLHFLRGEHEKALKWVERAVAEAQNSSDRGTSYNNLGRILVALQRWPEAEAAFRQSLTSGLDTAQVHDSLGEALRRQGRDAEALSQWRLAYKLGPGDAELLARIARIARQLGDQKMSRWAIGRLRWFDPVLAAKVAAGAT